MDLSESDAAYLAGLVDGEGTIGVRLRRDGYVNLELGICMTTPAPLGWAYRTTGYGGIFFRPERREGRRDAWFWKVNACHEVAEILQCILPFLQVKAAEARAFLVLAHLRRMKERRGGPVLHRPAEHTIARINKACKRLDDETAYKEAMNLAVYLRQALYEQGIDPNKVVNLPPTVEVHHRAARERADNEIVPEYGA